MKLNIKVQPNSGKQEVVKISKNLYKIFLNKSPKDNKANIELEKLMKKEFKSKVKIIKGFKSKNKIVEIN